jgi:hypothetical protein
MQLGRVEAFAVEGCFVEGNHVLGADQGAQVTAFAALPVNQDSTFEHTTPRDINKFYGQRSAMPPDWAALFFLICRAGCHDFCEQPAASGL